MIDPAGALSVVVALVAGAACAVVILSSRRVLWILALLVQAICVALLLRSLPAVLAIAYGIVGVCACGILAVTPVGPMATSHGRQVGIPSGMPFRVVAVLLVALASMSLARALLGTDGEMVPGIPIGAGLLMGLGLLQVGLSEEPLRVGGGLMSIIGGFEIGYATVESAIALHGLILGVPLLIALSVAYLLALPRAGTEAKP